MVLDFGMSFTHKACSHRGVSVKVGDLAIKLGADRDLKPEDFDNLDLVVPLCNNLNSGFGRTFAVLSLQLADYGGVPDSWPVALDYLIQQLKEGKRALAFCMGGHGRTGTLLASLIAILEPETEDPIEAARARYCAKAVESNGQAEGIYKLRGLKPPDKHLHTAHGHTTYFSSQSTYFLVGDKVKVIDASYADFGKFGFVTGIIGNKIYMIVEKGKTSDEVYFPKDALKIVEYVGKEGKVSTYQEEGILQSEDSIPRDSFRSEDEMAAIPYTPRDFGVEDLEDVLLTMARDVSLAPDLYPKIDYETVCTVANTGATYLEQDRLAAQELERQIRLLKPQEVEVCAL